MRSRDTISVCTLLQWPFFIVVFALVGVFAGCSKESPQARLDASLSRLQAAIEARKTADVMDALDANFRGSAGLEPESTRRLLTATFLRYQKIQVIALSRTNTIDLKAPTLARTQAQVLVTGAQGLIPERAEPYTVTLEWRLVGDQWKLSDLRWE